MNERNQFSSWFVSRPLLTGLIVFGLMQSAVVYIVYQRATILRENDKREMTSLLHVVYNNVEQTLKNASTASLTLALTINDKGQPENFDVIARQLIVTNPGIDAVQLVPQGVIKYIYPLEGNQAALGYNVLESRDNRKEALESIARKKIYFAGPMHLKQGGIGIVGRLPVYNNGKFWGFSGVLIKLDNLLKISGIQNVDNQKYQFQLSHFNSTTGKTEFFLPGGGEFSGKRHDFVTFSDTDWKLYIIRTSNNGVWLQLAPFLFIGTLLTMLFGFMISVILRRPAELQLEVLKQTRKLLNSEIKYKAIFDQAAIGIAHIDSNTGEFIEVNEQYCDMIGYGRNELKGKAVDQILHPDDVQKRKTLSESLRQGEIGNYSLENRYFNKSGAIVWANVTVSPLWKPGEKPTAQIAIAEDITHKKQAQEQIRKSEARFKTLFDNSPVALWEEDFSDVRRFLDGFGDLSPENAREWFEANPEVVTECISLVKIIDVNNECIRLHEPKTKKELLSANLDALLTDSKSESFIKQLVAVVKRSPFVEMDMEIIDEALGDKHIHLRWSVMRGYEDTLERVIISTEDITHQKEAQQIILSSQQRIESLVNTIDGIVWEADYNTYEFTYVNKKAEEITGYPVSEWLFDAGFWADKIHPEDRERAVLYCQENSQIRSQYDFEYRMIAKDGSILWLRDIVNVVYKDDQPISLKGIMIDITKNKEADKDLKDSLELVNEQKKRLMNFSYIVSHNLRSHAANIQSILTLIDSAESEEEKIEMLGMLNTVSGSLNDTMIHLNDLVNVQTNVTLVVDRLELKTYVENAQKAISDQIEIKGATIVNNVPEGVNVDYNPAYLESILLNLLSNALRYSHPERKPYIVVEWMDENGKKVLAVSDNGIGIDMSRYGDKLFGMYKTFHGNTDARGIGLFMTKSQVEAMGGTIEVTSEPDKGTTFKIHFKQTSKIKAETV